MINLYDVKRKTVTQDKDGVSTATWTVHETSKMEIQPIRASKGQRSDLVAIEIGGEQYIPTFYGWVTCESHVTATDYITSNSGTNNYLVLRTYNYEDHMELELRET